MKRACCPIERMLSHKLPGFSLKCAERQNRTQRRCEIHRGFLARSGPTRTVLLDQFRCWRGRGADPLIWRAQQAHVQSQQYRLAARVSPLFQLLRARSEYHLQQPDIRLPSIRQSAGQSLHTRKAEPVPQRLDRGQQDLLPRRVGST